MESIQVLDVVALIQDIPDRKLVRGQVGTVVEQLASNVFEVEFSDELGQTYAICPATVDQLMRLRYQPAKAS